MREGCKGGTVAAGRGSAYVPSMTEDIETPPQPAARILSDAAKRALAEAEARRTAAQAPVLPPEDGGPRGLEPTRYGDWEKKGLAIDF